MGARILPDTFDVVDDPTQKEWRGKALFGSYDVDREGVIPKPLHLVEKGALKGFLLTRQPVRGFEGSNGRARLPGRQANVAGHQQSVRQFERDHSRRGHEKETDRADSGAQ
jgi:TldD protein